MRQHTHHQTGQTLQDRYHLTEVFRKGGFGAVYLAEDTRLKRTCVVKQMLAPRGASAEDLARYRNNFEREANLLVKLNHPGHPNIPEIYDHFSVEDNNYLVMKYIEGESLKERQERQKNKRLPWRDTARYLMDVCGALHYMHHHSNEPVIHRDIKPANILIGKDERVWLVDFGLAKAKPVKSVGEIDDTLAIGSLGYTPLEQWFGNPEPVSDMYALGASLYHLVTGVHPVDAAGTTFDIKKIDEMHGQFAPLHDYVPDLPPELETVIRSVVAPDPARRLAPLQFQQALGSLLSGSQSTALFTFKNGQIAKDVREFISLCRQNRAEAQDYLYNGDFERWFRSINRADLATAAAEAVAAKKNQKAGLNRFLRQIKPRQFIAGVRQTTRRIVRVISLAALIIILLSTLLLIGGSYAARWALRESIGNYAWDFSDLTPNKDIRFTETEINDSAQEMTETFLQNLVIDIQTANQVAVEADWGSMHLTFPLEIDLEAGKPHFYISRINGIPLFFISSNLSAGINEGIDTAFKDAPVRVTDLNTGETDVIFRVANNE